MCTPMDHPRSRGEYTIEYGSRASGAGSSPLSRGIPYRTRRLRDQQRIIPALAGNTACHGTVRTGREDHPRSRGEYGYLWRLIHDLEGSSPLSRGIRSQSGRRTAAIRIIPALAGNTTRGKWNTAKPRDHPRSRGEYSHHPIVAYSACGSSPLSRGIRSFVLGCLAARRIIPALAGNTRTSAPVRHGDSDHPRSRGEYTVPAVLAVINLGSSPLSRGIRSQSGRRTAAIRIIPALAGNTSRTDPVAASRTDHPRSRGEYSRLLQKRPLRNGSSPLSRGIQVCFCPSGQVMRIIPALAGNTFAGTCCTKTGRDHPRSRGEYAPVVPSSTSTEGSSPLSRGILLFITPEAAATRIIPALAGNTFCWDASMPIIADHPRSRGEYFIRGAYRGGWTGSSPLSRGIPSSCPTQPRILRIIPALAGNT